MILTHSPTVPQAHGGGGATQPIGGGRCGAQPRPGFPPDPTHLGGGGRGAPIYKATGRRSTALKMWCLQSRFGNPTAQLRQNGKTVHWVALGRFKPASRAWHSQRLCTGQLSCARGGFFLYCQQTAPQSFYRCKSHVVKCRNSLSVLYIYIILGWLHDSPTSQSRGGSRTRPAGFI